MRTDPWDPDTDGDGISDWVESIRGSNPLNMNAKGVPAGASLEVDAVGAELRAMRGGRAPNEIVTGSAGRNAFIDAARSQIGDPYRFGAEVRMDDTNPHGFDSSELVEWSAAQAGIKLPDGSWKQYQHLHEGGNAVPVDQALRTPGALVFGFSSDPLTTSGRPDRAFVAISLGNGKVLDVSERGGAVRELDAGDIFTHGAVIPELIEGLDSDGDGVHDSLEREFGKDPFDPSSLVQAPAGNQTPADQVATTTDDQVATTPDDAVAATTTPADPVAAADTTTTTPVAEPAAENNGAAQVAVAAVELPSVTATPRTRLRVRVGGNGVDAGRGGWRHVVHRADRRRHDLGRARVAARARGHRLREHVHVVTSASASTPMSLRTAGRGGIASAPCPPRPPPSRAVSRTCWSSSAST